MDYSDVKRLSVWVTRNYPSMQLGRIAIVHGTSIDAGYPLGIDGPSNKLHSWSHLAALAASKSWSVSNYSVNGLGTGWINGGDSHILTSGTWLFGSNSGTESAPDGQTAGPWSSIWDITAQATRVLYYYGTLNENDIYFGGTANQCLASLQLVAAYVLATGGKFVVMTPMPRIDAAAILVGYEATRQMLLPLIRNSWQGGLGAVLINNVSDTSPIAVTTAEPHGRVTGSTLTIALVRGNTAANVTGTITVTGPSSFTLNGTTGNAPWVGGGIAYWGSGLGGSYLVDLAAEPRLSDASNLTYFLSDGVHLTDAGQAVAAGLAVVPMNAEG